MKLEIVDYGYAEIDLMDYDANDIHLYQIVSCDENGNLLDCENFTNEDTFNASLYGTFDRDYRSGMHFAGDCEVRQKVGGRYEYYTFPCTYHVAYCVDSED